MSNRAEKIKVLFVCLGNICRSPAAEGVFSDYVRRTGHAARFHIDSAGTLGHYPGALPDDRMQEAAARRGYRLESRARKVNAADLENFDLVLAMDHENLADLQQLAGKQSTHIRLLGSFLDEAATRGIVPPVPDPYSGGLGDFERVLDMIETACPALLQYCLNLRN